MTKKQYLEQARLLNSKIAVKLERYQEIKALAEKSTKVLTGMPRGGSKKADDTIAILVDMATDINNEIIRLTKLEKEISSVIEKVDGIYGTILEMYYLCFNDWQQVADTLGYDIRHIYRLYGEALKRVKIPQ